MQLYILDDRGAVVFTYFPEEHNHSIITREDRNRVIKVLNEALKFVARKKE